MCPYVAYYFIVVPGLYSRCRATTITKFFYRLYHRVDDKIIICIKVPVNRHIIRIKRRRQTGRRDLDETASTLTIIGLVKFSAYTLILFFFLACVFENKKC